MIFYSAYGKAVFLFHYPAHRDLGQSFLKFQGIPSRYGRRSTIARHSGTAWRSPCPVRADAVPADVHPEWQGTANGAQKVCTSFITWRHALLANSVFFSISPGIGGCHIVNFIGFFLSALLRRYCLHHGAGGAGQRPVLCKPRS